MKKVLSLAVVCAMLLGMASCADNEPNDTLPQPEETTDVEATDSYTENTPPETDEPESEVTSGEPETSEPESEVTLDEPETIETEGEVTSDETETTEPETSEPDEIPEALPGDETWCYIHSFEFHSYSMDLINYVGNDEFMSWVERCDSKAPEIEGCPFYCNIYNFIKEFDVPREVLETAYYGTAEFYFSDYNIDILYDTDEDTVNHYYMSSVDREEEREKYSSLGEIKFGIVDYAMMSSDEKMQEFFETYGKDHSICEWSIADFVKVTGIEKGDLQALIEDITVREYPGETVILNCFDFDYDVLYDIAASKITDSDKEATVIDKHNEDLVFCRQPPLEIVLTYEIRRDS